MIVWAIVAVVALLMCARRVVARWDEYDRRDQTHAAVCRSAYMLGKEAGRDLWGLEALVGPPQKTRMVARWDPSASEEARDRMTGWAARIHFASGRECGWWEAAAETVREEADEITRQSA